MSSAYSHFVSLWPWSPLELVNHLWQSTVVGCGILGLIAACRRFSAGTRRALAWLGMIQFALPKAWIVSWATAPAAVAGRPPLPGWSTLTVELSPVLVTSTPAPAPSLYPIFLTAIWLAGFTGIATYWLLHGMRARRSIRLGTQPISEAVNRRMSIASSRMGLRRRPPCLSITSEFGPGVLGIFSPVILLPRGLEDILEPAEYEAVAIHEIVHWQRRDNLWGALQSLLVSLLWFNPVMWLLSRILRIETEKSCDERVLAITDSPEIYAFGIAKTVRQALGLAPSGFAGMATAPVIERIENILAPRRPAGHELAASAAVTAGLLLVAFGSCTGSLALRRPAVASPKMPLVERVAPTRLLTPVPIARTTAPRLPQKILSHTTSPKTAQPPPQPKAQAQAQPIKPVTITLPAPQPPKPAPIATAKAPLPAAAAVATAPQSPATIAIARPAAVPRIYQLAELDHAPKVVRQFQPYYPKEVAEPMEIHADVTIEFVIDPAGRVIDARTRQCTISTVNRSMDFDSAGRAFDSSSHRPVAAGADYARFLGAAALYRASALRAVSQWAFSPGKKAGEPAYAAMAIVVGFEHSFSVPSGYDPVRKSLFFSGDLSRAAHASLDRSSEIPAGQIHDEYRVFIPKL